MKDKVFLEFLRRFKQPIKVDDIKKIYGKDTGVDNVQKANSEGFIGIIDVGKTEKGYILTETGEYEIKRLEEKLKEEQEIIDIQKKQTDILSQQKKFTQILAIATIILAIGTLSQTMFYFIANEAFLGVKNTGANLICMVLGALIGISIAFLFIMLKEKV